MKDRSIFRIGLVASTMLASTSLLAMAGEVTTPRLLSADKEPQNWLMVNKDYGAHRYSELDQINLGNRPTGSDVRSRIPSWRQPVHRLDTGLGYRHRKNRLVFPVHA